MYNFQKIAFCNVQPLVAAIARQPNLWKKSIRNKHQGTVHEDGQDIILRYNVIENNENILNDLDNFNYPEFLELPQVRPLIYDLMRIVEGNRLGRVFITKIPPQGKILPHVDEGASAEYYDRYHIFLKNYEGSIFRCGNEIICPSAGDVYWFNNQIEHEVINNSCDDRLSLIIDIKS